MWWPVRLAISIAWMLSSGTVFALETGAGIVHAERNLPSVIESFLSGAATDECNREYGVDAARSAVGPLTFAQGDFNGDGAEDYILLACSISCGSRPLRRTNGHGCSLNILLMSDGDAHIEVDTFRGEPIAVLGRADASDIALTVRRNFGSPNECAAAKAAGHQPGYVCFYADLWDGVSLVPHYGAADLFALKILLERDGYLK